MGLCSRAKPELLLKRPFTDGWDDCVDLEYGLGNVRVFSKLYPG